MSGHSKWSTIKRQKGAADAKRGQLFTKLGREIAVAARSGADPEANARLRLAIRRARDASMPLDTIDRAIKRGAGAGEGENYQEVTYEGYGPHGVAVLVDALTDNRNRSAAEIRAAFNRGGGNLGESGSVRWLFDSKGEILVSLDGTEADEVALLAIDTGAEDVQVDGDTIAIYTAPSEVEEVRGALETAGLQVLESQVAMVPKTSVELDQAGAEQAFRLIERLEDLDDVQAVYSNVDVSSDVAASLAG